MNDSEMDVLKSSDRLKQEIKCNRIIDFIGILYTVNPTIGSKIIGRVAEWFKATVLKTVTPYGVRGSNPFPSASLRSNVNENS